jgi:hypothetical protein
MPKETIFDSKDYMAYRRLWGWPEVRPVDPRHNEEAWAQNRRAHFVVTDAIGGKK